MLIGLMENWYTDAFKVKVNQMKDECEIIDEKYVENYVINKDINTGEAVWRRAAFVALKVF